MGRSSDHRERIPYADHLSRMTPIRATGLALGLLLLAAASALAFIQVPEPVLGAHCFALERAKNGQIIPACPDTRYVRHMRLAIALGVVAVLVTAVSFIRVRRVRRPWWTEKPGA
jgi:hypothetical protein